MKPTPLPLLAALVSLPVWAQPPVAASGYRLPPEPIAHILATPPTPAVDVSPSRDTIALLGRENLPDIAHVSRPLLRLGGSRIDPANNGPAETAERWLNALSFEKLATGETTPVRLPEGTRFFAEHWSPDGRRLAFVIQRPDTLELWVAERDGSARRLVQGVNATGDEPYVWMPDSSALLAYQVRPERGAPPVAPLAPTGPIVEENLGQTGAAPTYEDMLKTEADEALFDYYFTGQFVRVPLDGSAPRAVGAPGVISTFSVSPDGRYLLTERLKRPYSHLRPAAFFPTEISVTTLEGEGTRRIADRPLSDDVPIDFDAVVKGPREVQWRSDAPATLVWAEAQDGGDPKASVPFHDRLLMQAAPFDAAPVKLAELQERFRRVYWGRADHAWVMERKWKTRIERRSVLNPSQPGTARLFLERNYQDQYGDPGLPLMEDNAAGRPVMHYTPDGRAVFLSGEGATPAGAFPFLARQELADDTTRRVWAAQAPYYEEVIGLLDEDGGRLLTRRESAREPPNYFVRTVKGGKARAVTAFKDPAPEFAGVTQKTLVYVRADGLSLSGTLYLPAGYEPKRDGPLPTLLWAYPSEYTDSKVAGQTVDKGNRFTRPRGISHLFMLTQGYAVLDNPAMPIVGPNGAEPNDTYVEQLQADAEAAVDAVVKLGVADRARMAVGGHSYGAFMTVNLLAHTHLFRAGIARSGAYNRTLTPFGFQAEQRTYWQAPETYTKMSPFTYADRIKAPLLLIHGGADDNPGTFPIQSERLYAALKGHGATVRYVVLPNEPHGYRAMESTGHTLWEMAQWLDRYVKHAPAAPPPGASR